MPVFTPLAIRLASVYFPILVDSAKRGQVMTYKELVSAGKARHPDSEEVVKAIPVSSGGKLGVIQAFCDKSALPNLASLVVNGGTGQTGGGFPQKHMATELQRAAFAYDWSQKLVAFDVYVIDETKRAEPLKKRKEDEAGRVLFEYYKAHKDELPADITKRKPMLIALLMEGYDPADAFDTVAADMA